MRDILVLRCLCAMKQEDRTNLEAFVTTVEQAFGQSFSREFKYVILHSHRKLTWGTPEALPKTQDRARIRTRRVRPSKEDIQIRAIIRLDVEKFLAGKDVSDGATGTDGAEAVRPPQM